AVVSVGQLGAERVVALEHQRVVVGGDIGVGDRHGGGADDVPAVPVAGGGDAQVVRGDVVAVVGEDREMPTLLELDAVEGQAVAVGQRQDLVGFAAARVTGDEVAGSVDRAGPGEGDVGQTVAVEHRVVEVAVPVVLVGVVRVRLGRVVRVGAGAQD